MNPNLGRPQITPELVERFAAYYRENPAWGSLHIVLDDGNYEDHNVAFCEGWAFYERDEEGMKLAGILGSLTRSQRFHVGRKAEEAARG